MVPELERSQCLAVSQTRQDGQRTKTNHINKNPQQLVTDQGNPQKNQAPIMTQINGFGANAQGFDYPKLVANIRLKLELSPDIDRYQPYYSQMQELQAQINDLKAENLDLKTENSNLRRINQELQWRTNPNSPDGDAICNSDW